MYFAEVIFFVTLNEGACIVPTTSIIEYSLVTSITIYRGHVSGPKLTSSVLGVIITSIFTTAPQGWFWSPFISGPSNQNCHFNCSTSNPNPQFSCSISKGNLFHNLLFSSSFEKLTKSLFRSIYFKQIRIQIECKKKIYIYILHQQIDDSNTECSISTFLIIIPQYIEQDRNVSLFSRPCLWTTCIFRGPGPEQEFQDLGIYRTIVIVVVDLPIQSRSMN